MPPAIEEILYPAMEDFELDIVIGQGPGARSVKVPLRALHADRRDDARRAADLAAARAVRHRAPARLLHRRPTSTRSCADRRGSSARRSIADAARRDRAPLARHAAHRQPPAAPRARLRAGARRRPHHGRGRARGAGACSKSTSTASTRSIAGCCGTIIDKFGGGPVGLNSLAAAHQRRARRDRGHPRAVPDPDRASSIARRAAAWRPRAPTSTSGARRPGRGLF